MVHGYLATFGAYGSWMPNDPRGSKSKYVGDRRLYDKGGKVTKHDGKRFEELVDDEVGRLETLTKCLKRTAVEFDLDLVTEIGKDIGRFADCKKKAIWALAVLPRHIHLVFNRGGGRSEEFVDQLKVTIE